MTNITQTPRYYAVQVASACEQKVKATLAQRSKVVHVDDRIKEILIPTSKDTVLKKDGKRKIIDQKTYPGYIIIHCVLDEEVAMCIRSTPNVIDFVGIESYVTGRKRGTITPKPLKREEVLKLTKQAEDVVNNSPNEIYNEGDLIEVLSGPFASFKGEVIENGDKEKIRVMLMIFGRETNVEITKDQIQLINDSH